MGDFTWTVELLEFRLNQSNKQKRVPAH